MLSRAAFDVANYVVYGCSLHDLRSSLIHAESIDRSVVDDYLKVGLRELVISGMIEWTYEPDYGTQESQHPEFLDLEHFEADWERCMTDEGLRDVTPGRDDPTLFLDANDSLVEELKREEYARYE